MTDVSAPSDRASSSRGKKGEEQATAALKDTGMEIIAQNVRSRDGEVDIVALDRDTIVFIEVKAWTAFGMENLQYGLDLKKQRKIIKTAKYFLSKNRQYSNMSIRFDVVFVNKTSVTHLESAFVEGV
jgi:putative endonuclease